MSDHVDGPRQIGDPAGDLTDLFAFTSPQNPSRTVLAANLFPSAGTRAMFSNAVDHSILVRPLRVAGLGYAARLATAGAEIRFRWRFEPLAQAHGKDRSAQRGTCLLPDGQVLELAVDDEAGATTPDGKFRAFAGLRSDPFFLAWLPASLKKCPNLLQHDNVLCCLIEFDTEHVLGPTGITLFGAVAETAPLRKGKSPIGHEPPRLDWVGRPEQTNMRLNNPAMEGSLDLRDLWNQQTPFAISPEFAPLFRQRMLDSLANWDMRDGRADWNPEALSASANLFVDDFLVFDVSKPIDDRSHLEIEKSTLAARPYTTGGGRTVNANVIDLLVTWMVNHDREFLQGGATGATKPGTAAFPYLAAPNAELQVIAFHVDLPAPPDKVWAYIGGFGNLWHPLMAAVRLTGTGVGQLRTLETIDGKQIVERLESLDQDGRGYAYSNVSGIPANDYVGMLGVKPKGAGSSVEWRVQYMPGGQPDFVVRTLVTTLIRTGFASLEQRFGATR